MKQSRLMNRGSNIKSVRAYNERLVLSLIRSNGAASKAHLARETKLSPQTLTVIIDHLEKEKLVLRNAPIKGRVGQPSIPYSLNPNGAYSIGLKIGRRSYEIIVIDFIGNTVRSMRETCDYPTPDDLVRFVKKSTTALVSDMSSDQSQRICGFGVATPFEFWKWGKEFEAPRDKILAWRDFDIAEALKPYAGEQLYICNDATAACAAELLFGNPNKLSDFVYFYIGSFIGGGIALNASLETGAQNNAGAIGSMLVPSIDNPAELTQLISVSSIVTLEKSLKRAGKDTDVLWRSPDRWNINDTILEEWINNVSAGLSFAAINAVAIMDFPDIIIDGAIPKGVQQRIVDCVRKNINDAPTAGLSKFNIHGSDLQSDSRTLGAASLPILTNFGHDSDTLQKQTNNSG